MSLRSVINRFFVHGVFWRQLLHFGVTRIPYFMEPIVMAGCVFLFFFVAPKEVRGLLRNLRLILPGSSTFANLARAYAVFWNFGWSISERERFKEANVLVDWEFEGAEHLDRLVRSEEGAIVLTAHMGNYDLGAYLFAEKMNRQLMTVRAPEVDPDTHQFVTDLRQKRPSSNLAVGYSTSSDALALELLEGLQEKQIVAIQGDRVTPGISTFPTRLFGLDTSLPSGPFALAMATQAWIYPLFVIRAGRRRYLVRTEEPFQCLRTGRDREHDIGAAMERWTNTLERVIKKVWKQWYMFEPIQERPRA